jgi:H+/Cl- antiporter ClcA
MAGRRGAPRPQDALGKMGGGFGTWVSEQRKLDESSSETNTLSGMAAAYGGLLSSPILATIFLVEVTRPKRARLADTWLRPSCHRRWHSRG